MSAWKSTNISVDDVRWIIDGMFSASVVQDGRRFCLSLVTHDTRSKAKFGSMHEHSGLLVSSAVVGESRENDGTLALDGARVKVFWGVRLVLRPADGVLVKLPCFLMRGLAHSCRGMVWQRSARGILASWLSDDDEPVLAKSGPSPLWRGMVQCLLCVFRMTLA